MAQHVHHAQVIILSNSIFTIFVILCGKKSFIPEIRAIRKGVSSSQCRIYG